MPVNSSDTLRIFLSYGHDEYASFADRLKEDLQTAGHEVWFDRERLKPGQSYHRYIEDGLAWCAQAVTNGRFLLLMTPHSVRRPEGFCLYELAVAKSVSLPVISVMVADCDLPLAVSQLQWLDMRDCLSAIQDIDLYQRKFRVLLETIEGWVGEQIDAREGLLAALKPIDCFSEIGTHLAYFTGRQVVHARIRDWLSKANAQRVYWFVGDPGVGKSALAASLHNWPEMIAFHFCRYGHEDKSDYRKFLLSLAFQLSCALPEYRGRLISMNLREETAKTADAILDNLLVQPLSSLPMPHDVPRVIVLDGLDEATIDGSNELARFVGKEFVRLPGWLRLLVTSQPTVEVVDWLHDTTPFNLERTSSDNLNDIREFVRHRLGDARLTSENLEAVVEAVVERSEGIFLYAERVTAAVLDGSMDLAEIKHWPKGLGALIQYYVRRSFQSKDAFDQVLPVLEMILDAHGPLPILLVKRALGLSEYNLRTVLRALGPLFSHDSNVVQPYHWSVKNWLCDPAKAGQYFVNRDEGGRRLAEVCWIDLCENSDSMSPYTRAHGTTHFIEAGQMDRAAYALTDGQRGILQNWLAQGEVDKGIAALDGLISYLYEEKHDQLTAAGLETQLARFHVTRGAYGEAERHLEKAYQATSFLRGRRVRVVALHELASLRLYSGDRWTAVQLYRKALRLCLWGGSVYHDEASANLVGLATVMVGSYRSTKAQKYAERAMQEAALGNDKAHLVAAKRLLGRVHALEGRYEMAFGFYNEGLSMAEVNGYLSEMASFHLHMAWGQYERATLDGSAPDIAERHFEQALGLAEKARDFFFNADARLGLASCARVSGKLEKAQELLGKFQANSFDRFHWELEGRWRLARAMLAHALGNSSEARSLYEDMIMSVKTKNLAGWLQAKALVGLGALDYHGGDSLSAENCWEKALKLAREMSAARSVLAEKSIAMCKVNPMVAPR